MGIFNLPFSTDYVLSQRHGIHNINKPWPLAIHVVISRDNTVTVRGRNKTSFSDSWRPVMNIVPVRACGESLFKVQSAFGHTSLYSPRLLSTLVYCSRRIKHGLMSMFISYVFRHLTRSTIKSLYVISIYLLLYSSGEMSFHMIFIITKGRKITRNPQYSPATTTRNITMQLGKVQAALSSGSVPTVNCSVNSRTEATCRQPKVTLQMIL